MVLRGDMHRAVVSETLAPLSPGERRGSRKAAESLRKIMILRVSAAPRDILFHSRMSLANQTVRSTNHVATNSILDRWPNNKLRDLVSHYLNNPG